ncbi:MAG: Dyp-type peroxidase [Nitrospirae bacterium]|nr:Dyp-type peroxidase [Nitrospirota bacterium]
MNHVQSGILAPVPRLARYLVFSLAPSADPRDALIKLGVLTDGGNTVVGIGESVVLALGKTIKGLRVFPSHAGTGLEVPSTPGALWCWLRGDDRGELVHRTRQIFQTVSPAFRPERVIDAFQFGPSRDLTGYEDGTENPKGNKAYEAAIVSGQGKDFDGSSFVAVQQWVHDLNCFDSMTVEEQDNAIGRRKSDNEEIKEAPPYAHVKRTAQESFEPPAFILRRSMPWADEKEAGLVFVAFGESFRPFEVLLKRMVGAEDGIPDGLFKFTRPVSGNYFWCPPVQNGNLNWGALGL